MSTHPAPMPGRRRCLAMTMTAAALPLAWPALGWAAPPMTLRFRDRDFIHRWSKAGQHEFTPSAETDLKTWRHMLTLNQHPQARSGEQLAEVANRVLGNYQRHGKILQTRSRPRTASQPAEHLIVAVLGTPDLLEASFARCVLADGQGMVAVASHRIYGRGVGPAMSDWLKADGLATEQALMGWALPAQSALDRLPERS